MNKQLTLVIPCKNESSLIIETLIFILGQTEKFKIIVADSSTEQESINLLKEFQEKYKEQIKIIGGGLPSVARNKGAELVDTPYVLFLDADIHIKQDDLIVKCLNEMIIGRYDLLTCKFKTLEGKFDWIYKIFNVIQWFSSKTTPFALGGFMLFKTDTFNELKGFNNEDKIAEDYHLSSKISPSKFRVENLFVYTPCRRFEKKGLWYMIKLMVMCWWNRNNDDFFKQDFNYWI
jgi:cellulose synthase/poly-beta-1,6-N-acetylglucosamine synthase-like glycosyltransferase